MRLPLNSPRRTRAGGWCHATPVCQQPRARVKRLTSALPRRAYNQSSQSFLTNMEHVDGNALAFMLLNSAQRWIGLRLDILGAIVVSSTAFAGIANAQYLSPGLTGLALTYAWTFVSYVSFTIRSCADAEMKMNSVERMLHYTGLEGEMPSLLPLDVSPADMQPPVPPDWPSKGGIAFHNLDACYRPGLPLVLKGVSLKIAGGERIGVCGRTGSGKTSLLLALFRMLRTEGGQVCAGRAQPGLCRMFGGRVSASSPENAAGFQLHTEQGGLMSRPPCTGGRGIFWQGKFSFFTLGTKFCPRSFFAQSGPCVAPWVGGKQFSSEGRSWCPCIACQDQSFCKCVSQKIFLVYLLCIPRTVVPATARKAPKFGGAEG